ncbi:hypothetical protein B0H15DRAFT_812452 [Mycena belliarum]|uniref:Uncharacterized protein n=1 Tax=Mycena belliarum TaxID=1033014 RepID=A0AAD6XZI3_9AGAR|nr:hypothetical protein B0H15DRAFT_812452 [Mycena belliae]
MGAAAPLDAHSVLTILHYISPTIQPLPPHLVASQLAFRQSCLKLTPDEPAYLFWPSSDDQHILDALELLQQRPVDDMPSHFEIRYTADDTLCAHADLPQTGIRLVFQWEDDTWKYTNAAKMPFPANSSRSLLDLEIRPAAGDAGQKNTPDPDSYWDSYGELDHEDAAAEFEREQPETNGDYWDLYNSVQGSGDSVVPSPAPEKQRHDLHPIPFSYADMHPSTDPMESLSDRLEALSQRPSVPDEETVVDWETVVDSPPAIDGAREAHALKESLRGVYHLWRSIRKGSDLADKQTFLAIVHEVLEEP